MMKVSFNPKGKYLLKTLGRASQGKIVFLLHPYSSTGRKCLNTKKGNVELNE